MFHPENLPDHEAQCFHATGTIIAKDVKKLFENKEHSLQSNPRAIIFVDPDFDGYLAELARGLKKVTKDSAGARPKIAVVLTEPDEVRHFKPGVEEGSHRCQSQEKRRPQQMIVKPGLDDHRLAHETAE